MRWFRQSDRFDWLSGYLSRRGMLGLARYLMATSTASVAVMLTLLMLSPAGPRGLPARVAAAAAALTGVSLAALWLLRWPTRQQSLAFVCAANAAISLACVIQSDQLIGLFGCAGFAMTGSYLALFHSRKWLLSNFAIGIAFSVVQATRVAQ